jgi:hypothetical protein
MEQFILPIFLNANICKIFKLLASFFILMNLPDKSNSPTAITTILLQTLWSCVSELSPSHHPQPRMHKQGPKRRKSPKALSSKTIGI